MVTLTDDQIKSVAECGATVSRYCRNCQTGETSRSVIQRDKLFFPANTAGLLILDNLQLLSWESVAGLNQIRLIIYGQHSWTKADWEKAIHSRLEGRQI